MSLAVLAPKGSTDRNAQIVFEASSDRLRTWAEARREGAGRWAVLEVWQAKPKRERIGPGLDSITLTIRLDLQRGVVPRDELRKLRAYRDKGTILQLSVGGDLVGDYTVDQLAEQWQRVDTRGVLLVAIVELTLGEYN